LNSHKLVGVSIKSLEALYHLNGSHSSIQLNSIQLKSARTSLLR
jgi:hypothetical protein